MSRLSTRARRSRWAGFLVIVTLAALAAMPTGTALAAPSNRACRDRENDSYSKLLECMRIQGVRAHQAALQAIANANDGNRFSGFEGYDDSVDYVVAQLEAAGYDPDVQTFDYLAYEVAGPSALQQTQPNPDHLHRGHRLRADHADRPGRRHRGSYAGRPPAWGWATPRPAAAKRPTSPRFPDGNIALLQRGTCTFELKAENAAAAGAVGIVIFNQGNTAGARPPGHSSRHAHGQQHERHPGDRHHLSAG